MKYILYIHGLGGGEDSRIPAILAECLSVSRPDLRVVVRTYSFDPEDAHAQISSWVEELRPVLVIGESMGATHALAVRGMPHILVSPAMGTPSCFYHLSWLLFIPGVGALLDRIYRPRPGKRQPIHFCFKSMRKWKSYLDMAYDHAGEEVACGRVPFAFFGTHDHYLKWRIVNVSSWERRFGRTAYAMYEGSHFMEEEYIHSMLVPKICETLPEA